MVEADLAGSAPRSKLVHIWPRHPLAYASLLQHEPHHCTVCSRGYLWQPGGPSVHKSMGPGCKHQLQRLAEAALIGTRRSRITLTQQETRAPSRPHAGVTPWQLGGPSARGSAQPGASGSWRGPMSHRGWRTVGGEITPTSSTTYGRLGAEGAPGKLPKSCAQSSIPQASRLPAGRSCPGRRA